MDRLSTFDARAITDAAKQALRNGDDDYAYMLLALAGSDEVRAIAEASGVLGGLRLGIQSVEVAFDGDIDPATAS